MNLPFLFFLFLIACQSSDFPTIEPQADGTIAFRGEAMTMQYSILIGEKVDEIKLPQISQIILKTFEDTDLMFNKWNPTSELSKLNQQNEGVETPLSFELWRLFKEADQIVKLSQGKFDPSIEPLQQLWKKKLSIQTLPTQEEINQVAPALGWDKISFKEGKFKKTHDQTKLDFGGIAKGLCIDMLIERLNAFGIDHLFVEWGGEIRACGHHLEGRPWTIYISKLSDQDPEHALSILPLNDQAIATSGDYLQNWTLKGAAEDQVNRSITYFHIFDPQTLQPQKTTRTSIASASVIASSCALADGLATAAMMFSTKQEAVQWLEKMKEEFPTLSYLIISRADLGEQVGF